MKGQEAAEKIWDYPYNVTTPISGALYTAAGALGSSALNIAKITARLKKRRKKMNEETLLEKNVPTNPKLWAQAKAQAKKKFKIYPSAYTNGWASKWYKSKGGGWKTLNEDYEYEMARNELRTAMRGIERLMKHLDGEGDLEAWVQSKLTKASDYIDTLADYMDSRDKTVKEAYELISEAKKKMDKRTIPQTVQMQTPGSNPYADDSTCPSYVSTPGQPITEAKRSLKGVYKELARKKGPKAAEQRALLKALARGRREKAAAKAAKAAKIKTAKTPLYAGPTKGSTPTKPKTAAQNLSPKMKPEGTPAERIGAAFNRPGYESKKEPPMSPPNPKPTEPNTFEDYLHHIGRTGERISRRKAKQFIHRDYTRLMAAALGTDHPALKSHAIEVAERYRKDSIRTYRALAGGPIHKVLKALRLREEYGAGDIGTTELVKKLVSATPGQIIDPAEHKKPKITDTIKKVVSEEVLNEIRGEKRAIGIRRPYTARRRPGTKVKLNLARSKRFRALGTRGPVSPKKPRATATVAGAMRHAAKFTKKATTQRKQSQQSMRRREQARYTLTRAARG